MVYSFPDSISSLPCIGEKKRIPAVRYCLLQAPPARSGLGITNAGEQIRPAKRNGKKTEGENTDEAESVAVDKRPESSGCCAF